MFWVRNSVRIICYVIVGTWIHLLLDIICFATDGITKVLWDSNSLRDDVLLLAFRSFSFAFINNVYTLDFERPPTIFRAKKIKMTKYLLVTRLFLCVYLLLFSVKQFVYEVTFTWTTCNLNDWMQHIQCKQNEQNAYVRRLSDTLHQLSMASNYLWEFVVSQTICFCIVHAFNSFEHIFGESLAWALVFLLICIILLHSGECTAALHNLHKISYEQLDLYNQLPGFVSQKLACFSAQLRFVVVVCAFNFMRFIIYFLRLVLCRNGILLFFSLRRLFAI